MSASHFAGSIDLRSWDEDIYGLGWERGTSRGIMRIESKLGRVVRKHQYSQAKKRRWGRRSMYYCHIRLHVDVLILLIISLTPFRLDGKVLVIVHGPHVAGLVEAGCLLRADCLPIFTPLACLMIRRPDNARPCHQY
jgi:hypothetical protein